MTNNNENKSENKSTLKRIKTNIVKRIKTECKDVIKLNKLNDNVFTYVKDQASCIDACMRQSMSTIETIHKLVALNLCKDEKEALKRIKRHNRHDEKSRIISRNIKLNANV